MSFTKPFYRIARPLVEGPYPLTVDEFYVMDAIYAPDRRHLIRAYELLVEGLVHIFDYVEPSDGNLSTYSHRNYELILRASTEFETNCKAILSANDYSRSGDLNIIDYYKINQATRLDEYEVRLNIWSPEPKVLAPLNEWKIGHRLTWYQSYNKVKHDRNKNFREASLNTVLNALGAVFIILFAQFNYLAFESQYNTGMYEYGDDDFYFHFRSLFAIKEPSWPENEKYEFDWDTLKRSPSPIDKFAF